MILCLDVGNSQIFGGVFADDKILMRFRYDSKSAFSSDQHGIFLKSVLRENQIDCHTIKHIAICSVVPSIEYSLRAACIKYFAVNPFFLQAGAKTGLTINYKNPVEFGADRLANAIAATHLYPDKNLIIVDFGTATTICAISRDRNYLGGMILAGIRLSMHALQANTAKLFPVEIVAPKTMIAKTTEESLQAGLYYSQLATVKETTKHICDNEFANDAPIIIGTGGFVHLFERENIFTVTSSDLVLHGLNIALNINVLKSQKQPVC